jgi:hypothetical protein
MKDWKHGIYQSLITVDKVISNFSGWEADLKRDYAVG